MAIEDAAVLGNLFSRLRHPSQIRPMLYAYQDIRLQRTADTQRGSRLNQQIFHLPDGLAQEARDADMRAAMEAELNPPESAHVVVKDRGAGSQNQWADQTKNEIQFGYDADEAAEAWWAEVGEREIGCLGRGGSLRYNGRL